MGLNANPQATYFASCLAMPPCVLQSGDKLYSEQHTKHEVHAGNGHKLREAVVVRLISVVGSHVRPALLERSGGHQREHVDDSAKSEELAHSFPLHQRHAFLQAQVSRRVVLPAPFFPLCYRLLQCRYVYIHWVFFFFATNFLIKGNRRGVACVP